MKLKILTKSLLLLVLFFLLILEFYSISPTFCWSSFKSFYNLFEVFLKFFLWNLIQISMKSLKNFYTISLKYLYEISMRWQWNLHESFWNLLANTSFISVFFWNFIECKQLFHIILWNLNISQLAIIEWIHLRSCFTVETRFRQFFGNH